MGVKKLVKDIGERIAEIRRARGLNQDELAELATLSRISIARYETGKIEPGAKALGRIADALEVSTDVLLGRIEETFEKATEKIEPLTPEARIVSGGMDKLPKEQREQILAVVRAMFQNQPDLFTEGGKDK